MNKKTLHLLRQSPFNNNDVELCCANLSTEDAIVLIDDASYLLNHPLLTDILLACQNIYIIEQHALARGLTSTGNIQVISIEKLTQLIFDYDNSVTWQ
ncbi:sulfurtransferase complex subunit TusB [Colwellia sp. 1_MG-2023]|uniref:sulfurtransferase complex subunit TusB n=1 Tax=Colwellia sp. 1_MG-2023 TaxID=3062649 RepID=UPI0026E24228|nr:sulfurtransferase complex subunit TusB [Colwellia sp. 1_MG-2023]MDO6446921.1 sulfurtransferase complex subunit TusB [Colwellia sp. 1_MG-2023]